MPDSLAQLQPAGVVASLRPIAQALSAAFDVDTTLGLIAQTTTDVMGVDSCSIYLLEPGGDTLWLRASTGLSPQALGRTSLKLGEGLTGWAAQHGQPVAVRDAQNDARFKFLPQTRERNFRSLLAVPLVNRERIIGALNVQTKVLRDFSPAEVELAALISDLAAGALDRALLYDHMNRQLQELTTLARVSETVTSPLYLDEMLDLVVEMAAQVMGAPVCTLRLLEPGSGQLVLRSVKSRGVEYADRPPVRVGQGVTGQAVSGRRPIVVADIRTDPRYPFGELAAREGLVSMLSVPLTVRERVIGALNCYTTEAHAFSEAEIALFSTLANQTALAIENAQLATNAAVVREMHHRIKNNLQTVAMLLRMQSAEGPQPLTQALQVSINRIESIAAVHEVLSGQGFRLVNVTEVAERIAGAVSQNMLRPDLAAQIVVEGEAVVLASREATSLALVINELLQNALEHAFVGRASGRVNISLGLNASEVVVEVADDGVGLPATRGAASLGLNIVETLVRDDLHGRLTFQAGPQGTRAIVRVPRQQGGEGGPQ